MLLVFMLVIVVLGIDFEVEVGEDVEAYMVEVVKVDVLLGE